MEQAYTHKNSLNSFSQISFDDYLVQKMVEKICSPSKGSFEL